jgi:hypothetical protein
VALRPRLSAGLPFARESRCACRRGRRNSYAKQNKPTCQPEELGLSSAAAAIAAVHGGRAEVPPREGRGLARGRYFTLVQLLARHCRHSGSG